MLSAKNFLPQTLLARFMMIITVPIVVGQLLVIYFFYDRHWYNVTFYASHFIAKEIESLITNIKANRVHITEKTQEYLNLRYRLVNDLELRKKQYIPQEELEIFKSTLLDAIKEEVVIHLLNEGRINVLVKLENRAVEIEFLAKILISPTTYIFVWWLLSLNVVLLLVSLIFSKNQINSILELAKAADHFGRDIDYNYRPSGAKEIRKAGIAFIKMRENLKKQISRRTQMLAMISHDLRTPLTRMRLQVELMEDSTEKNELKYDIKNMQQTISSYLDFAKGEEGEEFIEVGITSYIKELVNLKWKEQNITFNADINPAVLLKYNAFNRALSNIVDNAIRYSSKITISIKLDEAVVIDIEDDGVGIKDSEKRLVFRPFYRSDKSRSLKDMSHSGLGLAIVKEIIKGHHGKIELKDSISLGGLLVRVTLPSYPKV